MNAILNVILFPFRLIYKIEVFLYNVLCNILFAPFYIFKRKNNRKKLLEDSNNMWQDAESNFSPDPSYFPMERKKLDAITITDPIYDANINQTFEEKGALVENENLDNIIDKDNIVSIENSSGISNLDSSSIPEVDQSMINQDIYGNGKKKKIKPKKVKKKKITKEEKRLEKQKKQRQRLERKRVILDFSTLDTKVNKKKVRYNYLVGDKEGNILKGTFDAFSKVEVHSFLLSQGFEVYAIDEDKISNALGLAQLNFGTKMKPRQLEFFLTQLSTYIKAGITLIDSVKILSRQTKKKTEKRVYDRLIYELNTGLSFSEALIKQENVFPKLLINMVKTAELTGQLTDVLDDMADYYKTMDSNRKQIISAMTYPSVIFVISIAIITFVILWVVPEFVGIYATAGAELPGITLMIINLSSFLEINLLYIILVILFVALLFVLLYKNVQKFRYAVQWVLLHIPIVKTIITDSEIIMFTKTFASLTNHDVFITDSMEVLGKITNNEIYKELIGDAIVNLKAGEGISTAFKNHWAFPNTAYEMMVTGERTGRMGDMMQTVANYYQDHQRVIISQMKSLIEPVMIILLAAIVGVILLSIVIPMFSIYNQII